MGDAGARTTPFRPLVGGTALWVFMGVEVLTFGMFLLAFAAAYVADAEVFRAGQALLHPDSAVRGTVILLLGSGAAYLGALAAHGGAPRRAGWWFLAAAALGVAFSGNKIGEYATPELYALWADESLFFFFYAFLTGLHLIHVVGGVVALGWVGALLVGRREVEPLSVDATAAYWHLVDALWVLIFPILYLMHA